MKRLMTIFAIILLGLGLISAVFTYFKMRETVIFLNVSWSPTSDVAVFSVDHPGETFNPSYYSIQLDTQDLQSLVTRDEVSVVDEVFDSYRLLDWQSDGQHILVEPVDNDIIQVDVINGDVTGLTNNNFEKKGLALSPIEDRLAFWQNEAEHLGGSGVNTLQLLDLQTGSVKELDRVPFAQPVLEWSPDGTQLAYWWYPDNDDTVWLKLYNIETDESHTLLMVPEDEDQRELSWSPTGKTIAYWTYSGGTWGSYNSTDLRLYAVDVASSKQQVLIDDMRYRHEFRRTPVYWSPDGSQLVVSQLDYGEDVQSMHVSNITSGETLIVSLWMRNTNYQEYVADVVWQGDTLTITRSDGQRFAWMDGRLDAVESDSETPFTFTSANGEWEIQVYCEGKGDIKPNLFPKDKDDAGRFWGCRNFELHIVDAASGETQMRIDKWDLGGVGTFNRAIPIISILCLILGSVILWRTLR